MNFTASTLVFVETKYIKIDKQQSELPNELSHSQWQALISVHQLLLYEHNDFFLVSQHPSASLSLKQLLEKYSMAARIWRYGLHSFLELLHHRLPDSWEYMFMFLPLAYTMMTQLMDSVPAFQNTWMECLGDLARYGMAVNMPEHTTWASVALYWYLQVSDRNPNTGRIQHHLAVVAWPDLLQQLFHYTKNLVSVRPFFATKESVVDILFDPVLESGEECFQPVTASAAAHGYLLKQYPISDLKNTCAKIPIPDE